MRIFRIVLSVLALGAAAVSGAQLSGAIAWNAALVDLITASGGVLASFGVTPIVLPPLAARACAASTVLVTAAVAAHSTGGLPGPAGLFNAIAIAGTLVGIAGRWQPPVPFPAKAGVQPPPPPPES